MASAEVRIAIAAGIDDAGEAFGTDAMAIVEAIQAVDTGDGVLVLGDVGSALLSTDTALEFLSDELRSRTRLTAAPLVEGALSAAVQASMGSPLSTVAAEAEQALQQKQQHVADGETDAAPTPDDATSTAAAVAPDALHIEETLRNAHGLHARPAAKLVRLAGQFDATITVENVTDGRGPVGARSLSGVSTLAAGEGDSVRIAAEGPDAEAALNAIGALLRNGFGEASDEASGTPPPEASGETPPTPPAAAEAAAEAAADDIPTGMLQGIGIQGGTAVGPVLRVADAMPNIPTTPPEDPEAAWQELQGALSTAQTKLTQEAAAATGATAGILDAQALLLEDPALRDDARHRILDAQAHPARAWMDAVEALADQYRATDDIYLQGRAADAQDVGRRVLLILLGEADRPTIQPDPPAIVVGTDLPPSLVAGFNPDHVLGVVCAGGSPTAHNAILLRGHGIPTVFGAGSPVEQVVESTRIGLDGEAGHVWIDPADDVVARLQQKQAAATERAAAAQAAADEDATMTDGTRIQVEANVSQPSDGAAAARHGADGVGLLRTEFLFDQTDAPPTEETQVDGLSTVAEALGDRPVTVRVLDAGGDKPLPYLSFPEERNPFLGLRGIRVLLRHPDLFETQLRAVLRVGARHNLRLLLPMVSTLDEVQATREAVEQARAALQRDGLEAAATLPLGIMVETPASALLVPQLASQVDFFSIGTNDLTQYVMAADREHTALADLSDALHPPVLRLIRLVTEAAPAGTVSLCGEAAADPQAIPVLLGLGVHRLSMRPAAIPAAKALIRQLSPDTTTALAEEAVNASSARAVRDLVRSHLEMI
jgi:phosphocarrier protein FPr